MNNETKQRIKELPGLIAYAGSEEVLNLRCPNCGGSIVIHFTGGERRSLGVSCQKHCFATNLDGMAAEPKWVSALGVHVVTGQHSQE
jgi:hypothetical protein